MQAVGILGIVLALGGLAGVLWCLRRAAWLRTAPLDDAAAKTELTRLMIVNMASVGAAFFGLGLLVFRAILG